MFAEKFDSRTVANMEVALERASKLLKQKAEQHEFRRYVASKILAHAEHGDRRRGSPRLEVPLPANFAPSPRRIAPGKNQPAPSINRIAKRIRTAITAVNAKAAPTRIAIWLKLRSSSDRRADIGRQAHDGFRFQRVGNRPGLARVALRTFKAPLL
jgi:hypothetical protein